MPFAEVAAQRNRNSRTYQHDTEPNLFTWSGSIAPLHYENGVDSGDFSLDIDFTPQRVNNAALDGWVATAADFHYALGIPGDGDLAGQDGVVGFGGRQGEHWIKFKWVNSGYLRTSNRALQLLGSPNYNRANLSRQVNSLTLPPNDDAIAVELEVVWDHLYAAVAGDVAVRWRFHPDGLKEYIVVDAAARADIATNHPPTLGGTQWFGFVFQFDLTDIPKRLIDGILKQVSDDVTSTGTTELRNAADQLLALLPIDYVYAGAQPSVGAVEGTHYAKLSKRWFQGTVAGVTGTFLFVGVPVATLAGLQAGDLVFDPTFNTAISTNLNDGHQNNSSWSTDSVWVGMGTNEIAAWSFPSITIAQGSTVSAATITPTANSDDSPTNTINLLWKIQAIDNASAPSGSNLPSSWSFESSTTAVTIHIQTSDWTPDTAYPYDMTAQFNTIVNRAGWVSGNRANVAWVCTGGTAGDITAYDYNQSAAKAGAISITYSAGGGGIPLPIIQQHRQQQGMR